MALDFGRDLIIRWRDPEPAHVELLKQARIQGVLLAAPHEGFEKACKDAGIQVEPESSLKTIALASLPADPGPYAALQDGLWPGISRGATRGSADEIASASNEPWVDGNSFRIAYLRALYPKAAPVLAYEANAKARLSAERIVPHTSVELGLAEARVMGGNWILSLPPAFREALLKNEEKALTAWKDLGRTAAYLDANRKHFSGSLLPAITSIIEPGRQTHEIANLMFRRNASPCLMTAASLPAPSKEILTIVTTGLKTPSPEVAAKLLAHAEQGASIVTDDVTPGAWWRAAAKNAVKTQVDRVFYAVGRGTIVAYNRRVMDPSEHSLDVIDVVTHPNRAVRVWNGPSIVALAARGGVLHLLNYGDSSGRMGRREIQIRMQGRYAKAQILRPEDSPRQLEVKHRGTTTEIFVQELRQMATVLFSV